MFNYLNKLVFDNLFLCILLLNNNNNNLYKNNLTYFKLVIYNHIIV